VKSDSSPRSNEFILSVQPALTPRDLINGGRMKRNFGQHNNCNGYVGKLGKVSKREETESQEVI
jgi:hypothetical protein